MNEPAATEHPPSMFSAPRVGRRLYNLLKPSERFAATVDLIERTIELGEKADALRSIMAEGVCFEAAHLSLVAIEHDYIEARDRCISFYDAATTNTPDPETASTVALAWLAAHPLDERAIVPLERLVIEVMRATPEDDRKRVRAEIRRIHVEEGLLKPQEDHAQG